MLFCRPLIFLKLFFSSFFFFSDIPFIVSNSLDPDQTNITSVLFWSQTVCKSYQQKALANKELRVQFLAHLSLGLTR